MNEKGEYFKICPCCNIEFYGRKNQRFKNKIHKSAFNNAKRAKEMEVFKPWIDEMIASYRALQKGILSVGNRGAIFIGELIKYGFNPDCPAKQAIAEDGSNFRFILDIAFRKIDDGQYYQLALMK